MYRLHSNKARRQRKNLEGASDIIEYVERSEKPTTKQEEGGQARTNLQTKKTYIDSREPCCSTIRSNRIDTRPSTPLT